MYGVKLPQTHVVLRYQSPERDAQLAAKRTTGALKRGEPATTVTPQPDAVQLPSRIESVRIGSVMQTSVPRSAAAKSASRATLAPLHAKARKFASLDGMS
eukprot:SAG11_NODE_1626_length_4552_cov_21.053223_2_plen_100_part_00